MGTWFLEAGEYSDREPVAIVIGTKREAEKAAEAITARHVAAGRPRDMVEVRVTPIKRVDQHGKVMR